MRIDVYGNIIIEDIHDAKDYIVKMLEKNYDIKVIATVPENFQRHYTIIFEDCMGKRKLYLIFQRKWFQSFPKYYGIDEEAVTINYSILKKLVEHEYDFIVWVSADGKAFMIEPVRMLRLVLEHGWIRKTEKTGETVAHLPLSFLSKIT